MSTGPNTSSNNLGPRTQPARTVAPAKTPSPKPPQELSIPETPQTKSLDTLKRAQASKLYDSIKSVLDDEVGEKPRQSAPTRSEAPTSEQKENPRTEVPRELPDNADDTEKVVEQARARAQQTSERQAETRTALQALQEAHVDEAEANHLEDAESEAAERAAEELADDLADDQLKILPDKDEDGQKRRKQQSLEDDEEEIEAIEEVAETRAVSKPVDTMVGYSDKALADLAQPQLPALIDPAVQTAQNQVEDPSVPLPGDSSSPSESKLGVEETSQVELGIGTGEANKTATGEDPTAITLPVQGVAPVQGEEDKKDAEIGLPVEDPPPAQGFDDPQPPPEDSPADPPPPVESNEQDLPPEEQQPPQETSEQQEPPPEQEYREEVRERYQEAAEVVAEKEQQAVHAQREVYEKTLEAEQASSFAETEKWQAELEVSGAKHEVEKAEDVAKYLRLQAAEASDPEEAARLMAQAEQTLAEAHISQADAAKSLANAKVAMARANTLQAQKAEYFAETEATLASLEEARGVATDLSDALSRPSQTSARTVEFDVPEQELKPEASSEPLQGLKLTDGNSLQLPGSAKRSSEFSLKPTLGGEKAELDTSPSGQASTLELGNEPPGGPAAESPSPDLAGKSVDQFVHDAKGAETRARNAQPQEQTPPPSGSEGASETREGRHPVSGRTSSVQRLEVARTAQRAETAAEAMEGEVAEAEREAEEASKAADKARGLAFSAELNTISAAGAADRRREADQLAQAAEAKKDASEATAEQSEQLKETAEIARKAELESELEETRNERAPDSPKSDKEPTEKSETRPSAGDDSSVEAEAKPVAGPPKVEEPVKVPVSSSAAFGLAVEPPEVPPKAEPVAEVPRVEESTEPEPIQAEPVAEPITLPVEPEPPKAEPVAEAPVTLPVEPEPVAQAPKVEEPVKVPVSSSAAYSLTVEPPTAEPVVEAPRVEEPAEPEPVKSEPVAEPITLPVEPAPAKAEPIPEPVAEVPVTLPAEAEPVAGPPKVEEPVKVPVSSSAAFGLAVEPPEVEPVVEAPRVEEPTEPEPIQAEPVAEPITLPVEPVAEVPVTLPVEPEPVAGPPKVEEPVKVPVSSSAAFDLAVEPPKAEPMQGEVAEAEREAEEASKAADKARGLAFAAELNTISATGAADRRREADQLAQATEAKKDTGKATAEQREQIKETAQIAWEAELKLDLGETPNKRALDSPKSGVEKGVSPIASFGLAAKPPKAEPPAPPAVVNPSSARSAKSESREPSILEASTSLQAQEQSPKSQPIKTHQSTKLQSEVAQSSEVKFQPDDPIVRLLNEVPTPQSPFATTQASAPTATPKLEAPGQETHSPPAMFRSRPEQQAQAKPLEVPPPPTSSSESKTEYQGPLRRHDDTRPSEDSRTIFERPGEAPAAPTEKQETVLFNRRKTDPKPDESVLFRKKALERDELPPPTTIWSKTTETDDKQTSKEQKILKRTLMDMSKKDMKIGDVRMANDTSKVYAEVVDQKEADQTRIGYLKQEFKDKTGRDLVVTDARVKKETERPPIELEPPQPPVEKAVPAAVPPLSGLPYPAEPLEDERDPNSRIKHMQSSEESPNKRPESKIYLRRKPEPTNAFHSPVPKAPSEKEAAASEKESGDTAIKKLRGRAVKPRVAGGGGASRQAEGGGGGSRTRGQGKVRRESEESDTKKDRAQLSDQEGVALIRERVDTESGLKISLVRMGIAEEREEFQDDGGSRGRANCSTCGTDLPAAQAQNCPICAQAGQDIMALTKTSYRFAGTKFFATADSVVASEQARTLFEQQLLTSVASLRYWPKIPGHKEILSLRAQ